MGLFQKLPQRITLSGDDQDNLTAFISLLKAGDIKDAKISAIKYADDEWHCIIHCKEAERIYYQKVLPRLYESAEAQLFRVTLEIDDKSEAARHCAREVMMSFGLKSNYPYGDEADIKFIQKLCLGVTSGSYTEPATISYYIVSDGAVTMSIPCLYPSKMQECLQNELAAYGVEKFMIDVVERQQA